MALGTIIASVATRLSTAYPTLLTAVGHEHVKENDTAPRIIWVPTSDTYSGAKIQKIEPRTLHTRVAGVEAHVWAKGSGNSATADLDATETLVNDVIAAMHDAMPGNYMVAGGVWAPAAKAHYGRVYVLSFHLNLPVTAAANTTVALIGSTQNVGMTFPSGNTVSGVPGV